MYFVRSTTSMEMDFLHLNMNLQEERMKSCLYMECSSSFTKISMK
jgi:hypothetical protein